MQRFKLQLGIAQLQVILFAAAVGLACSMAVAAAPTNAEELKAALSNPYVLLGLMYAGALASALKTVATAKREGSAVTYAQYFASWETVAAAFIAVPIAWGSLIFADQLNFAAAAAYGAIANTSLDVVKSGGRTAALQTTSPVTTSSSLNQ